MTNYSFIKIADEAADKIQAQIIELQSKHSSPANIKKMAQLKESLAIIEKQIEDLQKLGA
jgi:hypothetical protein